MIKQPLHLDCRNRCAFSPRSADRKALIGSRLCSRNVLLNAEGASVAEVPTGSTAKVVRLPFMADNRATRESGASTTYIVGVAGEQSYKYQES